MPRTDGANFAATTLSGGVGPEGLVFDVATTMGLSGNAYLVVNPRIPERREVILAAVTSGTRFTCASLSDRYLQGSADAAGLTHNADDEVWSTPVFQVINDAWAEVERVADDFDAKADDPHALGGAAHSPDTFANLNTKVSDTNLIGSNDVTAIRVMTESEYDALDPKLTTTLYVVTEDPE